MELQNHVVEDHLDFNFAWPDDSIFDQQFQWNDEYGFADIPMAMPRAENYPSYDTTEGHQQMPYYNPTSSSVRMHNPATGALEQDATPFSTLEEHQDHHTFVDRAQSAWHDSEPIHQPQATENNNSSASEASSPFSALARPQIPRSNCSRQAAMSVTGLLSLVRNRYATRRSAARKRSNNISETTIASQQSSRGRTRRFQQTVIGLAVAERANH